MPRFLRGLYMPRWFAVLAITALLGAGATGCACRESDPLAGSPGMGDRYLPLAGNGGYDVSHYEIDLEFDPALRSIEARATIKATATQALSSFNLDLSGLEVGGVTVDGERAEHRRDGDELVIVCPRALGAGGEFSVEVAYAGTPRPFKDPDSFMVGWKQVGEYVYTLDEPLGAATWYPGNDHPADKATYTFLLTVPPPHTAIANGVLVETRERVSERTFVWEMREPLAGYLATVGFGPYVLQEATPSSGGVPVRNYFAREIAEHAAPVFAGTTAMLDFFEELLGPYPFEAYGAVVPLADIGVAMENQTLSLFGADVVERMSADATVRDVFLSHELAHQWFGNSVTITRWADIWLNEGFATYASWLWLEHDQGPEALRRMVDESMRMLSGRKYTLLTDPGVDGLFSANVYRRGALTLHALRSTVGDDVFVEILREWVTRHEYGNATTAEFTRLAGEVASGVPTGVLDALFDSWLYESDLPRLSEAAW